MKRTTYDGDTELRPGLWSEERYIRMQVARRQRVARMPEPDVEIEPREELCTQCLVEVPAETLVQGICDACRPTQCGRVALGALQRRVLAELGDSDISMSPLAIAAVLGGTQYAVRSALERLRERGLVSREQLVGHGARRYALTEAGRAACE